MLGSYVKREIAPGIESVLPLITFAIRDPSVAHLSRAAIQGGGWIGRTDERVTGPVIRQVIGEVFCRTFDIDPAAV